MWATLPPRPCSSISRTVPPTTAPPRSRRSTPSSPSPSSANHRCARACACCRSVASSARATNATRVSARGAGTVCPSTARSCGIWRWNPIPPRWCGSRRPTGRSVIPPPWAGRIPRPGSCPVIRKHADSSRKTLETSRFPALYHVQCWKNRHNRRKCPGGSRCRTWCIPSPVPGTVPALYHVQCCLIKD